jgi:hypothetical protein
LISSGFLVLPPIRPGLKLEEKLRSKRVDMNDIADMFWRRGAFELRLHMKGDLGAGKRGKAMGAGQCKVRAGSSA